MRETREKIEPGAIVVLPFHLDDPTCTERHSYEIEKIMSNGYVRVIRLRGDGTRAKTSRGHFLRRGMDIAQLDRNLVREEI